MSAAMIYQRVVQEVTALESGELVLGKLLDVLRRFENSLIQLIYEWMRHCGHSTEEAVSRCVPILIQHCAIHLADDISDGDCDYLDNSTLEGPTILCLLQNLVAYSLERNRFQYNQKYLFHQCMHNVGVAQMFETTVKYWDFESAKYAAEYLNGEQCKGYFSLGASSESQLYDYGMIGFLFGSIFHIATDRQTRDLRFWSLSPDEQSTLLAWANDRLGKLYRLKIPCLNRRLGSLSESLA